MPTIEVCGLGPGGPGGLTEATAEALVGPHNVFLRTSRHPTAVRAVGAESFDAIYEQAASFEDVYHGIADRLVAEATEAGHVVYAVPGSPLVLERSVQHLRSRHDVEVTTLPAVSFLDEVWSRLAVDPIDDGVRLVDGHRFATEAAGERGPLLVAHVHAPRVLSDIKLSLDAGTEQVAIVLQRLGTADETVLEVPWPELDRSFEPDHLTTLYLPEMAAPVGHQLARSVDLMYRLRQECPWDSEQDHGTLRKHLVEEAYEVLDAVEAVIERGDGDAYADLEEELGDLWFQILFHAQLATEAGQFTIADVAEQLVDKMIGRHPHVYSANAGAVIDGSSTENWERMKQEEKSRSSVLDGIPASLPALAKAEKVLKKGGASSPAPVALGTVGEALASHLPDSAGESEVGQVLLVLVELARRRGVHAEEALRSATAAAATRFRAGEQQGSVDDRWVIG